MKKYLILSGVAAIALLTSTAQAADDISTLFTGGKPYADLRYRYEHVDQDGPAPITKDAKASTLRTKIGFQTGTWQNLQGQVEYEITSHLGNNTYNDSLNGHTAYPAVTDPINNELNQLWASWAGLPQTVIKGGRQIVNLDNQRFIGAVGWRQNDQTFDSVAVINNSIKDLSLMYGYVWNVNRIQGDNHALGDLSTHTHIIHADYTAAPWMKVTPYGYFINLDQAAVLTLASKTWGLRLAGEKEIAPNTKFSYTAEGAHQSDYGHNTHDFSNNYFTIVPGVIFGGWTAQAGYEVLQGDGVDSFQTPLATLHAFNGWADKFLTTPANGLEDTYGRIAYKFGGVNAWVDGTTVEGIYHNFDANHTGARYGSEWDAQISKTFKEPGTLAPYMKEWSVSLKMADFNADSSSTLTDTNKYWITLGTKF